MAVRYTDDDYPIFYGGQNGGGSSVEVESLSVTENGVYTAEEGSAYSPVTVNVAGSGGFEPVTTLFFEDHELVPDEYEGQYGFYLGAGDYQFPIISVQAGENVNIIYYPKLFVVFDDVEYLLEPIVVNYYETNYGGWDSEHEVADYSEYPFYVYTSVSVNMCDLFIGFETGGTHDVSLMYYWDVNICDVTIINESSTSVMVDGYGAVRYGNHIEEDTTIQYSIPFVNGGYIDFMPDNGSIELSIEGEGSLEQEMSRVTFTSDEMIITISDLN